MIKSFRYIDVLLDSIYLFRDCYYINSYLGSLPHTFIYAMRHPIWILYKPIKRIEKKDQNMSLSICMYNVFQFLIITALYRLSFACTALSSQLPLNYWRSMSPSVFFAGNYYVIPTVMCHRWLFIYIFIYTFISIHKKVKKKGKMMKLTMTYSYLLS